MDPEWRERTVGRLNMASRLGETGRMREEEKDDQERAIENSRVIRE